MERVVGSRDPNEILGPSGVGSERWLSGQEILTYAISFENVATATADAQQVFVTSRLGPHVNIGSLQLAAVIVDGQSVSAPASFVPKFGLNSATFELDLRPVKALLVRISVQLNPATNRISWSFDSIDPATRLPPSDPTFGFLPPGSGGTVAFAVRPTAGLPTGTVISNQASIVFDVNPPLAPPDWTNLIDNAKPMSHVSTLPQVSAQSFLVQWEGSDEGSGVTKFDIFVSDNGQPFTPFLTDTLSLSGIFKGQPGHTYAFYSLAHDAVGNVEESDVTADAVTTVASSITCDIDGDQDVNVNDLNAIRFSNGQMAEPGDPRDANGDGRINVADLRYCQLRLAPR